ncbi:MAG: hypothetical protein C5B59_05915 [Bacteroidetes bacterium]|nr:MAG: hypothetical protein C5B59_05915 [Bacteroidota bacterium]
MRLYLIISLLLLPLISISQNGKSDSLKKILASFHDSDRVDCLNKIGFSYFQRFDQDSTEFYAKKAYDESTSLQYAHGIAVSLMLKSNIYFQFYSDFGYAETLARESLSWFKKTSNRDGFESAEAALANSLFPQSKYDECYLYDKKKYADCQKRNDNDGMFDALCGLGVIHFQKGNYDSSFYFFIQAQQLAQKIKNHIMTNCVLFNLGTIYRAIEDYPTALNCYRQAFQTDDPESIEARKGENWDVWVHMEYAELFALEHRFDSAWYYYNQFDTTKIDKKILRIYLVSTGETYFLQKKYREALQNFLRGLVTHKELKDYNEVKRTLLDIARIHLNLNDNEAALRYAREGLDLSLQTKSRQFIRDAYQILYSVYDGLSKRDSAYYYYRQYIAMKEAVTNCIQP